MLARLKSLTGPTAKAPLHHDPVEWQRCVADPVYFLCEHAQVYNATPPAGWYPFHLWPAQKDVLRTIDANNLTILLKARQLGFSWLVVGYTLWTMLFRPQSTILIFSKRDDEAIELLDFRLKGMHDRLPEWMLDPGRPSKHEWMFANGSRAKAFPTTGGRSYTGTLAIIDEADRFEREDALNSLLNAVKPTIDAGGKLVLLSSPDKSRPESTFKNIYRAAVAKENNYAPIFCGWNARPGRTPEWYEDQRKDIFARTGSYDDCKQEYPATSSEALSPRELDKRIPPAWLEQCYQEERPQPLCPTVPQLQVFRAPVPGRAYALGADPAEGNPQSDDSALTVLDHETGEEVASLAGRYEPGVFAGLIEAVSLWYNPQGVGCMVERNNHGHAVLLWLRDNGKAARILWGWDKHPGWLSSSKGKTILYDACAEAFRDRDTILHSAQGFYQLSSIEGATLRAPEGQHDDRADGYALAIKARLQPVAQVVTLTFGEQPQRG